MNFDGNNVDNMAEWERGAMREGEKGQRRVWKAICLALCGWRMESTVNALHIVVVIGESVC